MEGVNPESTLGLRAQIGFFLVVIALAPLGCTVSADLEGKACSIDGACASGFVCIDSMCIREDTEITDGGPVADGGPITDLGVEDVGSNCGARGEACCAMRSCSDGLLCVGDVCSCNRAIVANEFFSCVQRADGPVLCVGANESGQLGRGNPVGGDALVPDVVLLPSGAERTTLGAFHGCALETTNVYCWGRNEDLQLGFDLPQPQQSTAIPTRLANAPTTGFQAMSLGSFHSCGRDRTDGVWCWGRNVDGQCGVDAPIGENARVDAPVEVTGLPDGRATGLAAGAFHTCALVDADVWCWGLNASRQLGITGTSTSVPQQIPLERITKLAAGDFHTCALRNDGVVLCWGRNNMGQLGLGFEGGSQLPTEIATAVRFTDLAAMDEHTCAISQDEELYCWGRNAEGQLGLRRTSEMESTPRLVLLDRVQQVTGGRRHTCAMDVGGAVFCFGAANRGQLGLGDQVQTATPTESLLSCP